MTEVMNSGIRCVHFIDLMLLFGLPLFQFFGVGAQGLTKERCSRLGLALVGPAALGLLASLMGFVIATAAMAGVAPAAVDPATLRMVATSTAVGTSVIVRCISMVAVIATTLWLHRAGSALALALLVILGAIDLASLAWAGHAGAGEGWTGLLRLAADVIHLWAAGAWAGALVALLAKVWKAKVAPDAKAVQDTHEALSHFGRVGSVIVALIVFSGALNGLLLIGLQNITRLPSTLYGQLLLAKLALFCAMLALAASNRFRLTPALGHSRLSANISERLGALRRSIAFEASFGVAVLILVSWLGTLEPPNIL